ncbi:MULTISPECIES: GNAT family N-acetyltransferase [Vibrio]|uniref:GNAT family N-acetyltransferase n=1 Tax=Vibrio TaxID=662 RepID=UPI00207554C8|nr:MULTISPECIES: GNAT family N-acetyltransferase [Vibrio]USD34477.1 GNAT family N-acetyltransferase [Vibrio sp. SCSIO 43186]USD47548.1 GNAT family N-acetyltransferase [Vibrio sp. SCSIO 43145]USD71602.1 GNAT family N-acetyltransferase [Vibrio sp. SCSIO 43139]USD98506.1 spermidine acetyltransferase [Vibrio coralliilyticus]
MNNASFLKVNGNIIDDIIDLTVEESQKHLIASNAEWLAQASFNDSSISYAIYLDQKPAGLISLIDPRLLDKFDDHFQKEHLYVWRVMIDHRFQGKGLGNQAINFSKRYASMIGLQGVSLTTMDKEEGNALSVYQKLGFTPTGRRLDDEIELIFSFNN